MEAQLEEKNQELQRVGDRGDVHVPAVRGARAGRRRWGLPTPVPSPAMPRAHVACGHVCDLPAGE